jgi:hypothetical protein
MRSRSAYAALTLLAPALASSCAGDLPPTEVVVVVDADNATLGQRLSQLNIAVYNADGLGYPLATQGFALGPMASGAIRRFTLPLSFAVAPAAEPSDRAFRVVVEGSGPSGSVETQAIAAFAPHKALRLDVILTTDCLGVVCNRDMSGAGLRTCVAGGVCDPVPTRSGLPAFSGGELGGYERTMIPGSPADGGTADVPGRPVEGASSADDGTTSGGPPDTTDADGGVEPADTDGGITTQPDAGGPSADGGAGSGPDAGPTCPPAGCMCPVGSNASGGLCVDIEECTDSAAQAYCVTTGSPCEETDAPGYICRGHRADWPMPDALAGAAVRPNYELLGSGESAVVRDLVTGLEWAARPGRDTGALFTLAEASGYCSGLVLGGSAGFRLPTLIELASILDTGRSGGSVATLLADARFQGAPGLYWTQTTDAGNANLRRMVSFLDGTLPPSTLTSPATARVRCVRSPRSAKSGTPQQRFTQLLRAGSMEVGGYRDVRTGLAWSSAPSATPVTLAAAGAQCVALSAATGVSARLPTYKELVTLLRLGGASPFVDAELAPGGDGVFWTASQAPGDPARVMTVSFSTGTTASELATNTAFVRCVASSP